MGRKDSLPVAPADKNHPSAQDGEAGGSSMSHSRPGKVSKPPQRGRRARAPQIGVGHYQATGREKKYILQVLKSGRISPGPFVGAFEERFAAAHQARYGIMLNSGTSALRLAVACLKEVCRWQDGDEILVPALTFVASSNVVIQLGLRPVFVDVDPRTYNLNPEGIEAKLTARTRAIMPVHLFGQPCDMDEICAIARKNRLRIIEDACETPFARYKGRPVGSFGDIAAFSTYVAHILVTGVGGLALTDNPEYAVILKSLANHGRDSIYITMDDDQGKRPEELFRIVERRFKFVRLGYSFRATEFQGALGLAQLEQRGSILAKRRQNALRLLEGLADLQPLIQLPFQAPDREHVFMMFPIVIRDPRIEKRALVNFLEENRIETRDMLPLLNQPVYRELVGNIEDHYPVAKNINNNGFYVGCHNGLGRRELDYMIAKFHEFLDPFLH